MREAALLAAINCLNLAQPDNQWIAIGQPRTTGNETRTTGSNTIPGSDTIVTTPKSPKRDYEGEIRVLSDYSETIVVSLQSIENELKLVQARLILAARGISTFGLQDTVYYIKWKAAKRPSRRAASRPY